MILVVATGPLLAQRANDEPMRVARTPLASLLRGESTTFATVTLPTDGVETMLRQTPPTGQERARIDEQIERIRLSTPLPPLFEGQPIDDTGEPRYWLAERTQQTAGLDADLPAMVVKRFLHHLVNRDTARLAALTSVPAAVDELTRNNDMAGADRGHVAMLCLEMPVAKAREGEVVRLPSGTRLTVGASAEEQVYVGLLGTVEVPFRLRKMKGQ
ncbi:hypothetical protein [Luteitalea sp.]|uniref:hypothetical protein n=1 Tax=Luteitalea sp. TaxID=2004800 RepID=UPI0025B7B743|nr:hypothetical protein [Luteitalea sp.]